MLYQDVFAELKKKLAYCYDDAVSLSYTVPDVENGMRVDKAFLYRNALDTRRTRPFALLVTAANDGRIVELTDCRYRDFVDPERFPFTQNLDYRLPSKQSIEDFKMEQGMLRKLYEAVRLFAFETNLEPGKQELLEKYRFLFEHAVPKDLIPFYRALSPRFEAWVVKELAYGKQ